MPHANRLFNLLGEIAHSDLKRQVEFMKIENTILRQHCLQRNIHLSDRDRRKLLKYGQPLGGKLKYLISIVHYSTFRRWIQDINNPKAGPSHRGRPRLITDAIKQLIIHMAKNNKWGYTKILAELKKLAVKRISRTSVKNILKEYGVDPFKIRSQNTWDQFLKRTFDTLWACDFFTKSIWTPFGRRLYTVLFFINIKTRQVHLAGITHRVDQAWLMDQTRKLEHIFGGQNGPAALVRDRDIKFSSEFDAFFEERNIKILKIPHRSPNLNPYAESWVATIKRECLNHYMIISKVHLEYLVKEFIHYYNTHRPHSSMNNQPLAIHEVKTEGEIQTRPILGGLVHHYYRD